MKVLFLNNYFYMRGGSERVLFEEMRILREAGHQVAVFSRKNPRNEPSCYEEYFPPEIETDSLQLTFKSFGAVKELIYSGEARTGLRRVIEEFQPNIVHAHNIYGRLSVSVLDELKACKVPAVLTLHDLKLLCPSYLMLNRGSVCEKCKGGRFYHAVLSGCHKNSRLASAIYALEASVNHYLRKYDSVSSFIAPSRFLRDKFVEYGWNSARIAHVPNFIECGQMAPSIDIREHLLYFGRLSREKGVTTLLKSLIASKRKIGLTIAGDGPVRLELQKIVEENSLPVTFTGHLSGSHLQEVIKKAKAVVIPSESYENAPMSILESFAFGKPVIGARIGGIPEMIDDGVNGYLFEPCNVKDLQGKVETFFSLPEKKIAEMGLSARAKVEQEYNAESHFKKLMQVYSDALGKSCT